MFDFKYYRMVCAQPLDKNPCKTVVNNINIFTVFFATIAT